MILIPVQLSKDSTSVAVESTGTLYEQMNIKFHPFWQPESDKNVPS
jgi:hypothetical protein